MDKETLKRLKDKGWQTGTVQDFLGLKEEQVRYIETKLALSKIIRKEREKQGYTQEQLAKKIHSSQSRLAKMEAGQNSVSLDLMIKTLFSLGVSNREIANVISKCCA
ncbi:helix-turn-helix transcriptional regulator [bacterium]|nr:helix-turn-helix transcriptional regulator [bacterium]